MKKFTMFACLALALVFALSASAGDLPNYTRGNSTIHGGNANFAKAGGDTINLMAGHNDPTNSPGEPAYFGDFEDASGAPAWNGWTSYDITQPTVTHWSVSTQNADAGQGTGVYTAWCGEYIDACTPADSAWGYGASWSDLFVFQKAVGNPGASATVDITADLRYNSEPGYDFTFLSYAVNGVLGYTNIASWDDNGGGIYIPVAGSVTYLPTEYIGGTDVAIFWRFQSDGGWDDGDCSYQSDGASNVDNISITITQGLDVQVYTEDFEDASFGPDWAIAFPDGVGDYAQLWENLNDVDPCQTNFSAQAAFIDDGLIVPGTGGTNCVSWCYGPSGYVVNNVGGLAGPAAHIHNAIESPVMVWPNASFDGIFFNFSVYRHEEFSVISPGIFYTWGIRSADTDDSAGNGAQVLSNQAWLDRNFVYLGGPDYVVNAGDDVTDLMNQGRDEIQVQLTAFELGYVWGAAGTDGTPAPYFDNARVKIFPYNGPGMSVRELDLAQDNFPEDGVDLLDLGSMHVRFDMANNISLPTHLRNDPGDTIVVDISAVRSGADFDGPPSITYLVNPNPIFNAFRTEALSGTIDGGPAVGISGLPTPGKYAFDLPDTGLLFPGDVVHYFISATDAIGGLGGTDPQTSTLPADTTGFATFGDPLGYSSSFTVRALPSLRSDGGGGYEQPGILFWNDFANRGGENEWYTALNNIGLAIGDDYDVYYTNAPSSGVGNGLGGRAALDDIIGYDDMLYTVGNLGSNTISNGDFEVDAGADVQLLTLWLAEIGKDMFLTGDDLANDLVSNGGTATQSFAELQMGVTFVNGDLRSFIGNQTTPLVKSEAVNPVFTNATSWIAYGGCLGINTFDAVTTTGGGQLLAQFTDPSGNAGAYVYSAATLNVQANTSRVISMPYDFMFIYTNPDDNSQAPLPARTTVLEEVLQYFGVAGDPLKVTPVTPEVKFAIGNYPNPFNPSTKIFYTMPKAGHLTLKVYNVRGELVKTLIDGQIEQSGHVMWDGTNDQGSNVSSGVYFYEARTNGEVQVNKMALVK